MLLERAGFMSVQRLGILRIHGGIRAALSPGEYQSHARYLYSDRRAETFVSVAREGEWSVNPKPHIAFFQAPPYQRLYLDSTMDCDQYVKLWQGARPGADSRLLAARAHGGSLAMAEGAEACDA